MSQIAPAGTPAPARPGAFKRWAFRAMDAVHAFLYRRGIGRSMGRMQQVLLTTTGRVSGKTHTVALSAVPEADGWVVIGSFGGAGVDPNWWLNLVAHPEADGQDHLHPGVGPALHPLDGRDVERDEPVGLLVGLGEEAVEGVGGEEAGHDLGGVALRPGRGAEIDEDALPGHDDPGEAVPPRAGVDRLDECDLPGGRAPLRFLSHVSPTFPLGPGYGDG